ncbi:MAG: MinD/ParA family protein [Rickettsiales bacterium]|jgi:flagellar biosynthesis protein FlhG|nr:MinD/ParA family protein [Rickettsiales bacterium]
MNASRNHIVAIASGKGGVGKTWLSVTLAHLCARTGKRVLLFDGDIGLANVDVQLGLTPPRDLSSVLSGKHSLKEAVTRFPEGGFDIIAGRSGSASLASLPPDKLERIASELITLQQDYDLVFLDLGAGVEQNVQYLASIASKCLVVVTDEPTSLTDGYAFIKIARGNKNPPDIAVVINQASTQKEGESTYHAINKACVNFLNISPPLYGIIRRDNKVKDSIRNQKSLITRAPHSTAATDAAALSVKLMQHG